MKVGAEVKATASGSSIVTNWDTPLLITTFPLLLPVVMLFLTIENMQCNASAFEARLFTKFSRTIDIVSVKETYD
jgi:hypothetical protein